MQSAMCLASVFGPLLMILGLWMLFYYENMIKMFTTLKNVPSVLFLLGFINLLLGLTILTQNNTWEWSLFVMLTVLGWVYFIRGLLIFFVPQLFIKLSAGSQNWLRVRGVLPLLWGLGLTWLGYWS